MKKIVFVFSLSSFLFFNLYGQTEDGAWQIEVGNSVFGENILFKGNGTGFSLFSVDGETNWSIGGEFGYFVENNLALKFGAGFANLLNRNYLSYKLGLKYYVISKIPFQIDFTGSAVENFSTLASPDPFWFGIQSGYAFFVKENISFEPSLRYNLSLNQNFTTNDILELRFGFAIFL